MEFFRTLALSLSLSLCLAVLLLCPSCSLFCLAFLLANLAFRKVLARVLGGPVVIVQAVDQCWNTIPFWQMLNAYLILTHYIVI